MSVSDLREVPPKLSPFEPGDNFRGASLSNAVHGSDSLIFTNLKAIFFGKYLSKRAFTASRSPVCRKAEI